MMRVVIFILVLLPNILFSQIEVIKVSKQPNVFDSCCGEVISCCYWPKYVESSWYGNPDVTNLTNDQTSNVWFSTTLGPRIFYTNISENQRIFRGDTITLFSGGGRTYKWNTGETTRVIKVSPTTTTTYSVTMEDDIEYSPDRIVTLSVTVFVEDAPVGEFEINVGNDFLICKGESITLSPKYQSETAQYNWSNGETTQTITVTPNMSQTFSVTITEGQNKKTDNILIIVSDCN